MSVKLFDSNMFAELDQKAQESDRRRSNCNIHESYDAPVQRLFITLYPDSYIRPHKHIESTKWEFFLMVSGEVSFLMFSDNGECTHRYELSANGDIKGIEIPPNVWHCVVPKSSSATFFEVKQGPYIGTDDKGFASWSPPEGDPTVPDFLKALQTTQRGEKAEQYL